LKIFNYILGKDLTPEKRKARKGKYIFGFVSGVLLGLSFPPVPLPYLVFVALIPYLIRLEKLSGLGEINRLTYFTAFIFNLITLYWVGSWTPDADPFLLIAGTVLMFFNPLLFLIPSTLFYFAKKYFPGKIAMYLLPVFWVTYEYLYSVTEFRFPWLTLGNSLPYFRSFIQIADIIGVYGLSLIILYINVFFFYSINRFIEKKYFSRFHIIAGVVLLIIPMVYGNIVLFANPGYDGKIKVGLIQPNLNPWKKWEAGNLNKQLNLYFELSEKAIDQGAQVLIWPETALPVYLLSGRYEREVARIRKFLDSNSVSLITGMPHVKFYHDASKAPEDAKSAKNSKLLYTSYNSALVFNPGSESVQAYGKIKLVPFGEKVPYVEKLPFLGKWIKWNVGISSWNTGKDTTVFTLNNKRLNRRIGVAAIICIESIYPDFVASFVEKGADFISVVTNDSWYGNSSGPYQHKEISVLRAVENRRYVVRAANGGISCIVDAYGRTLKSSKMFERTVVVGDVYLSNELTFYTRHRLLIPNIVLFFTLIVLLYAIFNLFKQKFRK